MLRELFQRAHTGAQVHGDSLATVIASTDEEAPAAQLRGARLPWWSAPEQSALAARWPEETRAAGTADVPRLPSPLPPVQGAHDLPAGVLPGVLRGAGCPTRASGLAYGTVEYGAGGRPRVIVVPPAFSERCRHAVATILRLGTATGPTRRTSVVPLQGAPAFGTRLVLPLVTMADVEPQGGVKPPRVRKQVRPEYAPDALAERVEGKVWLAAMIDEHGDVREVEVLRPLHPSLNREAIVAMSRWRFHPAMHDGRAAPVRVTVEMEFSLRK